MIDSSGTFMPMAPFDQERMSYSVSNRQVGFLMAQVNGLVLFWFSMIVVMATRNSSWLRMKLQSVHLEAHHMLLV